jgi:hygromycin-B 7''-O-kinase
MPRSVQTAPSLPKEVGHDAPLRGLLAPKAWAEVMRSIADRHGLDATQLSACPRGSDVVYRLGSAAVIKLTTPRWAGQIRTEATFLRAVAGKLQVATPDVLADGDFDGWPYVVTSFVAGEHLADVWPGLSRPARVRVAEQLGALMAELHQVTVPALERPDWTEFLAAQRASAAERQRRRGTPEPWLRAMDVFLQEWPELYAPDAEGVSLHTELLDAHVFVDSSDDGCNVCGLIDFADGMHGKADYDIAALVEFIFRSDAGLLRACLSAYGWPAARMTEDEGTRLLGCSLLHRYASVPRMLQAAEISLDQPPDFSLLRRRLYALEAP